MIPFIKMQHRKRVYIAGPYRDANVYRRMANIMRAMETGYAVFKVGHIPIIPHGMTFLMCEDARGTDHQEVCERQILSNDIVVMLTSCHCVLMVEGWEKSAGSRDEKAIAEKHGLPVFTCQFELAKWLAHQEALGKAMDMAQEAASNEQPNSDGATGSDGETGEGAPGTEGQGLRPGDGSPEQLQDPCGIPGDVSD